MTAPYSSGTIVADDELTPNVAPSPDEVPVLPKAIIALGEEKEKKLISFLDGWLQELISAQQDKQQEWAEYETAYRARPEAQTDVPFVGANKDVIPVVAMAVEPVHARLETGIFKQDPFVNVKPIRKSAKDYVKALEHWLGFYFTKVVPLQKIAAPALLEQCKLGTMVFKVPYVQERCVSKWYNNAGEVVSREFLKFRGPRPEMVSLGDLLFPPHYQHLQQCPVIFERQRTTIQSLKKLEYNKYIANVDKISSQAGGVESTELESTREAVAQHESNSSTEQGQDEIVVYEAWFSYDLDLPAEKDQQKSSYPQQLVATYEPNTRTLLQLRYNPYYHQRYPYVVVPYTIANGTLYGVGIGEMATTFQRTITSYQRNSIDNSFLANCRGFKRKRNSGLADKPIIVMPGFTVWVDDTKDVEPFQLGDVYASTIAERQNLFGMVEKRTGVSDYLTGRESPALGSRATATSTLALIQEGTRRVEQVMSNERAGFQEIFELCMMCWAQFGLGDIDDYIFGDEDTGQLLDEFFKSVISPENAGTLLTVDISPVDATTNRQVQQQMQLGLIQLMTQYMTQLLQACQLAIQAQQQGMPQLTEIIKTIITSAQIMHHDLLDRYDLPNADAYLPDVLATLDAQPGGTSGAAGVVGQLPPVGPMGAVGGGAGGPGSGLPASFGGSPGIAGGNQAGPGGPALGAA